MAIRVTVNEKGVIQQESGTAASVDINVPLNFNSTATVGGLSVMGTTRLTGAIQTLVLTNAGSDAVNGRYTQQTLTGGNGSGATADIYVAGNIVTVLALRNPGSGYAVGDVLSCATIGGSGFIFTVSAVVPIDNINGNITGLRIGSQTTSPRCDLDVIGSGYFSRISPTPLSVYYAGARFYNFANTTLTLDSSGNTNGLFSVDPNFINSSIVVTPSFDHSACTTTAIGTGIFTEVMVARPNASGNTAPIGVRASIVDSNMTDTGKSWVTSAFFAYFYQNPNSLTSTFNPIRSYLSQIQLNSTNASTASTLYHFDANTTSLSNAAHVITTGYGLRVRSMSLSGGSTVTTWYGIRLDAQSSSITNSWGISQEDTIANNVLSGKTAIGQTAGTVPTAFVDIAAGTTATAALRFRSGTAPTSPNDGDVWFDGSALKIRISGVTRTFTVS